LQLSGLSLFGYWQQVRGNGQNVCCALGRDIGTDNSPEQTSRAGFARASGHRRICPGRSASRPLAINGLPLRNDLIAVDLGEIEEMKSSTRSLEKETEQKLFSKG
jgi:hypothetical protein